MMAALRASCLLLPVLALGCGGFVEGASVEQEVSDEERSRSGAEGDTSDQGDDTSDEATGNDETTQPSCKRSCVTAENCVAVPIESRNADNWACADSVCVFLGCHTDDECIQDWGVTKRCANHYSGVPDCLESCVTADDCDHATDPKFYECRESLCQFVGCADDAQCGAIYPDTVCDETISPPRCVPGCERSSECRRPVANRNSGPDLVGRWEYEEGECINAVCAYPASPGCGGSDECSQGFVCR